MKSRLAALFLLAAAACAHGSPAYLARVNDEVVTGRELRAEFARHHTAMEKILGDHQEVRRYLDRLVDRRLFVQEAYRMGLEEAPDVKEAVARYRGQRLVEQFLRQEVEAHVTVTDEEVKAVHDGLTEQIEARQLVLATREQAEAARAALAAGADFEAMVRERSTAESAKRGGFIVVGWGAEETYETTLGALAVGQLSPVVQTSLGWEVLRLEGRKAVERPAYDKVAGRIRQVLQHRKRDARERQVYGDLWARAGATVLDCAPTVEALRRDAAERPDLPCATWQGGGVTVGALAKRVKLDQLGAAGNRWPELRKALVEDLVARALVEREAEARGLGAQPEVAAKVRLHQDDLVESRLYRDHVIKGLEAGEEDARSYYQAHLDDFSQDTQLELAQILVKTMEEARDVEGRLAGRQPFAELATSLSKDPSTAPRGGLVGFVEKRALKGALAPIAALGEGEVSAPIQTEAGFHLVKVLSVRPATQRPFEEVAGEARQKALEAKQKAETGRWVAKLRAAARIEVSEPGIRAYEREQRELLAREQAATPGKGHATRPGAEPASPRPGTDQAAPQPAPGLAAPPAPPAPPGTAPPAAPPAAPAAAPAAGT